VVAPANAFATTVPSELSFVRVADHLLARMS
jgi:hypothetical protein